MWPDRRDPTSYTSEHIAHSVKSVLPPSAVAADGFKISVFHENRLGDLADLTKKPHLHVILHCGRASVRMDTVVKKLADQHGLYFHSSKTDGATYWTYWRYCSRRSARKHLIDTEPYTEGVDEATIEQKMSETKDARTKRVNMTELHNFIVTNELHTFEHFRKASYDKRQSDARFYEYFLREAVKGKMCSIHHLLREVWTTHSGSKPCPAFQTCPDHVDPLLFRPFPKEHAEMLSWWLAVITSINLTIHIFKFDFSC